MADAKGWGQILKETGQEWSDDDAMTLGAAVAYYAIFSLAPVLILIIAIAGLVYGQQAAQGQLAQQIQGWVGPSGAQAVQSLIANASAGGGGVIATVTSIALVLLGASAVFAQLQMSLNRIWDVEMDPDEGMMATVRQRALGLLMVFGLGLLVIATIVGGSLLSNMETYVQQVPVGQWLWVVVNGVVSLALLTVVFALLFKYIPDAEVEWRDVWIGAALTAFLFVIGKLVLGWYLGRGTVASGYGAASSLVVLLAWIYYSTLILFLGAEFTQIYARASGREIEPGAHAIRTSKSVGGEPAE